MTWEIFLGLVAIVGFFITVATPLAKLVKIMTELSMSVNNLKEAIKAMDTNNMESHQKLWAHNDIQDNKLENHEKRITTIECKLDLNIENKK